MASNSNSRYNNLEGGGNSSIRSDSLSPLLGSGGWWHLLLSFFIYFIPTCGLNWLPRSFLDAPQHPLLQLAMVRPPLMPHTSLLAPSPQQEVGPSIAASR